MDTQIKSVLNFTIINLFMPRGNILSFYCTYIISEWLKQLSRECYKGTFTESLKWFKQKLNLRAKSKLDFALFCLLKKTTHSLFDTYAENPLDRSQRLYWKKTTH